MKERVFGRPCQANRVRGWIGRLVIVSSIELVLALPVSSQELQTARVHPDRAVGLHIDSALRTRIEELNGFGRGGFDKFGRNISGIVSTDSTLVIGSDEGVTLLALERAAPDSHDYRASLAGIITLDAESTDEIDIEGLARGDKYIYAIGSHSRKRLRIKNSPKHSETVEQNLERLAQTAIEPSRERLFRLKLADDGAIDRTGKDALRSLSLRDFILNDPVLGPFQVIAGKENGVNIEGIAARGDTRLYVGFRGPKLRGNYVPVMLLRPRAGKEQAFLKKFKPKHLLSELRYVNLGGLGIRDMVAVSSGIVILGGPVGEEPLPYRLFFWDEENAVPGKDARHAGATHIRSLCELAVPREVGAEGLTLLEEDADSYTFMVVFDGANNGAAQLVSCDK